MDSMPSSPRAGNEEEGIQDVTEEVFAPADGTGKEVETGIDAEATGIDAEATGIDAEATGIDAEATGKDEETASDANKVPVVETGIKDDDDASTVVSESDEDTPDEDAPVEQLNFDELESTDFTSLYRETNLNLFVKSLEESGLIGQSVRILLACKSKYVNINIARDIFGWSQNIKYKTEQFKTFVPTIEVKRINELPASVEQAVTDVRPIFDGIKNKSNADATQFIQEKINDKVIMSSSVAYCNQYSAGTPMLDLVLQNPGSIYIVTENGTMDSAFDFLKCSIMKASKKKKMVEGQKTIVKTFNLRDILYILTEAGATDVTVINASNGFTFEDEAVDEGNELDEGGPLEEEKNIFDDKEEPENKIAIDEPNPVADEAAAEPMGLPDSDSESEIEASNEVVETPGNKSESEAASEVVEAPGNKSESEVVETPGSGSDNEVVASDSDSDNEVVETPGIEGSASEGSASDASDASAKSPMGGKQTRKHKAAKHKKTRKNPTPL
jgi:hypothetical protein